MSIERKAVRIDSRTPWLKDVRRMLSPMSGVTDRPFRDLCRAYGMQMGFCEFASAAGLMYGGEATWKLVDTEGEEDWVGIQIFGAEPEHLASAARLMLGRRHDVLDLNFGCPAKKVVKKCGGSALLADLPRLEKIVQAVIAESDKPVTAKIRTGWDEDSVNYREVGLLLQEAGIQWVTMHGRTRSQKYRGEANWDHIADLVETLDIPVVGNGDVVDAASYEKMIRHTRCHAVMIGRGAFGNPWIFREMESVDQGVVPKPVPFEELCRVSAEHVRREVEYRGEPQGCYSVRKHLAKSFRGYPGAAALRKRLFATEDSARMIAILNEVACFDDPRGAGAAAGSEAE